MKSVWLNEITWQNVAEYLTHDDTVLLPIGSTEQHGPAGPLGVDTYAAIAIAKDAAEKAGVLAAPPLWYGDSPHHLGFPGTISLRTETMVAVVKDIVHSLAKNGFRRFIAINGHKSTNLVGLTTACRELHEYELPDVKIALTDPLWLAKNAAEVKETAEHHSGELEISHVMYKFPGLVDESKLTENSVDLTGLFGGYVKADLFGGAGSPVEIFWNSREQRAFAPTGSFSASAGSSREKGKAYHDNMVENLVRFIDWYKTFELPQAQL